MATKKEIDDAFEAAVQQMVAVMQDRAGMNSLTAPVEEYVRLSGASPRIAQRRIATEAKKRLGK